METARQDGWAKELEDFLNNPDALRDLGFAYGGSVSTRWPRPVWARPDRGFDLERAVRGEAIWHFSRNFPGRKIHEYDPFMAPPKEYLNEKIMEYFLGLPGDQWNELQGYLAETKRPDQTNHLFGRGRLRFYSQAEITELPTDTEEEKAEKQRNLVNAKLRAVIRWHLDRAVQYAYFTYIEEYKTSVFQHRKYLQDPYYREREFRINGRLVRVTNQSVVQISGGSETEVGRMEDEELAELWTNATIARNPNLEADEGYLGYFVQMPPTLQYAFWKRAESKIRYADERDGRFDGQTESERIYAYYLVQRMFTWWERLPRVDDRGVVHYKWYTHPDHTSDKEGCNGCAHYDAESKLFWIPADGTRKEPKGWVYEEELVWHPTRQAIQLQRKIMYTHNVGSHLSDIFSDLILGIADAKTFRANYGGGGDERVGPYEWWWPGAPRSDTLVKDKNDPKYNQGTIDTYLASGFVARDFWLGPINDFIETERARPYNGIWLKHHMLLADFVESMNHFREFLRRNRTLTGVGDDDLSKELPDIKNFDTAIVLPNKMTADRDVVLGVRVDFDEKTPTVMLWEDIAGHVDPAWFYGRSFFNTDTLEQLVEDYERSYQDWMIPGTKRFREDMEYILTWPNDRKSKIESFRHEHFYQYLRVNWTNHERLARDFQASQNPARFESYLRGRIEREGSNGDFRLRPLINKLMDGLPLTTPVFDDHGNIVKRKANKFGELRAWAYQYADNQFYKSIVVRARDRGVTWGDVTSAVMEGYGQGYGSKKDQLKRIFLLYEVPLTCIYYDTWKGIIEEYGLMHHAGVESASETWNEALKSIASALRQRKLSWPYIKQVGKDIKVFGVPVDKWIEEHMPEASGELEGTWETHMKELTQYLNPNGGEKIVEALHEFNLLYVPSDPNQLLVWSGKQIVA